MESIRRLDLNKSELDIIIEMFEDADNVHPLQGEYLRLYNYLKMGITESEHKDSSEEKVIELSLQYAKDVYTQLENQVSMGIEMVGHGTTHDMTDEQKERLMDILMKYHNANCSPFNRHLKNLIDEAEAEENK